MDKVVDSNVKDLTFPQGVPWANGVDRALIVAQLSHFDCGGIALSVCLSHKIGDGSSAYCFLRDWAALTRSSNTNPSPYFVEDSIVPSPIGPLISPVVGSDMDKCVQKRFVFSSTKLSALKSSIGVQNVTSNEAVNTLVYKCAASSATIVNSDFGFGKPIRASFAKGPRNKFIILMRTYDGGIEAFVNLNEQEMCVFEHDKQLLEFAIPINGDFCYEEEQRYI
ncbi:acyltransferase Pun1-like [Solanum verrucosum]|uniref:acyltransferase Pun1-like n=1 Tax=Solanum verrucosum TaxID=315347 RepID=UPI0020D0B7C1|nr:acyltransferase Pun1-like [Solanum verrucosum]